MAPLTEAGVAAMTVVAAPVVAAIDAAAMTAAAVASNVVAAANLGADLLSGSPSEAPPAAGEEENTGEDGGSDENELA
ncbi:hypothetical protein [Muricoccus vinaceus]|uniref:Uncharacterized protein n=1 Tax=Muricoccus vinaceus TaxID=424704 RepID=A0ABV6IVM7_9PROT